MLKRITLMLCAALLIGAFAQAATKATPAPTPKIEGTIQSIDAAKHTVTVQVGTDVKTITVSSKTTYMVDGKKSHMTDLKAGQNVSIDADSKNVAKSIDVKPQQ